MNARQRSAEPGAVVRHPSAISIREAVYRHLLQHGPHTQEELSQAMHVAGNTLRPRLIELAEEGRVIDSGLRRRTRAGRWARAWMAQTLVRATG